MNDAAHNMIVYEVNLDVDATVIADYRVWLDAHVAEICALPGFTGARIFEVIDPPARDGRVSLCVQYRLRDASAFEAYLEHHAPRLRADGLARFGDHFTATRRVLVRVRQVECEEE
ncbi:DUF4286 family protein [Marilutibacter alkalisoli]|uniref:DUF4286 family protein n=1 Tax=Marilutibacter alkalisoli TaxID=2591633 RepID=A0A514BVF3_9GAMM|nr:DUF4286 family protein [Lysobacter alkalisoli]QDH71295.1 DUF4286 family protein [Lysobacter alkalisoli]